MLRNSTSRLLLSEEHESILRWVCNYAEGQPPRRVPQGARLYFGRQGSQLLFRMVLGDEVLHEAAIDKRAPEPPAEYAHMLPGGYR